MYVFWCDPVEVVETDSIRIYLSIPKLGRRQTSNHLKPNSITLAGSKLVADHGFEPDSVMEYGFEPVCDQLWTSFEPASVMEFGFYINVTEGFIICLQGRRNAMNWGAIIWIFIRQWIVHSTLVLPQAAVPEKYAEPMCLQG